MSFSQIKKTKIKLQFYVSYLEVSKNIQFQIFYIRFEKPNNLSDFSDHFKF